MELQTKITLQKQTRQTIDYHSNVLLLGSCFTENVGNKLEYFKFKNLINPLGILFQPLAIENLILRAINNQMFTEEDIFFFNERWHSFAVHSSLSTTSKEEFLLFVEPAHAWFFEELSGNTVINSGSSFYSGTLESVPATPTRTTGKIGNALSFDGLDDRMTVPSFSISGNELTLSLWMNLKSLAPYGCLVSNSNNSYRPILRLQTNNRNSQSVASLTTSSASTPFSVTSSPDSFTLDTWHHVAVIYDGSFLRIFVDGNEIAVESLELAHEGLTIMAS